ncbi:MAG: topoisomerase protein [Candidatus Nomurabacteria bacterium GW2011_GWA2_40_9]|uniref:DNA topoisomerase 1 n=1 Tax=Candidatus Nomurabacteria bacterium GW2011_GWA2_40_9 TaxID=1618734 RepID=A0A0G0TXA7_9BACT|nr:MAG: topoisomerase protein [Candidatus Nomurabacteria bacterium GW2011_GWA2_40_9]
MKLLIVESPSKAKTIEKYLEGAFTVRASVGHIRDLPKSNKKAIDIEAGFVPHYEISKGKEKVVHELQSLAEKATSIMLATDPDREGEAIAWHIEELLNADKKVKAPIQRVTFHEITKQAIEEALEHPREIDTALRKAQEARRVLDRLVGYDLSGIIWKKVRYGLSAGRVQSPALRIIMEREREIRAFVPEKFWRLFGDFETPLLVEEGVGGGDSKKNHLALKGTPPQKGGEKIRLECEEEPRDEKLVDKIMELGKKGSWVVSGVKESEQKRVPRAPFTTSTLQQTASSRLGYSPSRTMQLAQKLYEAGHITYMRTDSTNLSALSQAQIIAFVKKEHGVEYAEARIYKTKSKNAQEAHEAIRPTHIDVLHAGTEEQQKLYRLIWERAVSSQMTDAKLLKTKITAIISNSGVGHPTDWCPTPELPAFSAVGSRLLFGGWLKVDSAARGEDVELPKCIVGEKLKLLNLEKLEKFTEPPCRYSEAGLVKELESRGIGRPSTYASIMRTLEEREYVKKEGKTLFPTDVGEVVSDFLENNFAEYISDTFTAGMEDQLDEISRGESEYEKVLKDFYGPFLKEVKAKDKLEKATNLGDAPDNIVCPKCGGKMMVKLSRAGKFYSCLNYPDCAGALMLDGKELEGPKEIGEMCPLCGLPAQAGEKKKKVQGGKLVIRERHDGSGSFISCSRYPKCKFIKEDEEEKKRKMTDITCPTCGKNKIMERKGRFGIFYSCASYPDCKFAMKAKPTENICKECGSLMMLGTKTIPERCSNKACKMHNPHKLMK